MDYAQMSYQQYADLAHEQDACWDYLDSEHRRIAEGAYLGKDPGFSPVLTWPIGAPAAWMAEIEAAATLRNYEDWMTRSGEWDSPCVPPSGLHGQDYTDAHEEYIKMISIADIHGDMCRWEDDMACHLLFAENTWDKRGGGSYIINRRSEVMMKCNITRNGENYLTGTCSLGKVFIPRYVWKAADPGPLNGGEGVQVLMKIRFLGFNGCRKAKMPWRAEKIM